jgi:peptidoglycan L-alanyl-D-glutamate endopeptidase CwlK
MYKFSKRSKEELSTCHVDLQLIMETALSISNVDFGISEGHRSIELQKKYFDEGSSQIDGIHKKGKHNYTPSLAADIYAYVNGKVNWDEETLTYINGIIYAVAQLLYKDGKITHKVREGLNWDGDGEIITDQTLIDRPHIELITNDEDIIQIISDSLYDYNYILDRENKNDLRTYIEIVSEDIKYKLKKKNEITEK